jgi:beta-lactamase regulating signal transducer with metallopeptidase domain
MNSFLPPSALFFKLGWTLIHFLWQGAAIAFFYGLSRRSMRRESANLRYLAGCLALASMVLAPVFTLGYLAGKPIPATPAVSLTGRPTLQFARQIKDTGVGASESAVAPIAFGSANRADKSAIEIPTVLVRFKVILNSLLPWVVRGWGAGVMILTMCFLAGWFKVQRIRSRSILMPQELWRLKLEGLIEKMAISRPVRLLESAWVESPAVIGYFKPVILAPASAFTGLSPCQLELLLAHELAHIQRHDYLVNVLQGSVEILLFYHPAVWWVSGRIREEREHCCDDLAVATCGNRLEYVRALAAMEEIRALSPAWTVGAKGGSLVERVRHLVRQPDHSPSQAGLWVTGLMVVVLGLSVIAGSWKAMAAKDESAIALFKEYLSNPKPIQRLLIRYQLLSIPESPDPKIVIKLSPPLTNNVQIFTGTWKSNAFYLRELRSLKELDMIHGESQGNEGLLFAGRLNDRDWEIVNTDIYSTYTQKDPKHSMAEAAETLFTTYMTFGLDLDRPQSIAWSSDHEFEAEFKHPDRLVHGALVISNGLVMKMSLTNAKGNLLRVCDYSYMTPNTLPTGVTVYGVKNGALYPQCRIDYLDALCPLIFHKNRD